MWNSFHGTVYCINDLFSSKEQLARVTAVYYLSQQVGQIIGTKVSAMALQRLFRPRVDIGLCDISVSKKIQVSLVSSLVDLKYTYSCDSQVINKILKDYSFTITLPPAVQAAVQSSYIEAYR